MQQTQTVLVERRRTLMSHYRPMLRKIIGSLYDVSKAMRHCVHSRFDIETRSSSGKGDGTAESWLTDDDMVIFERCVPFPEQIQISECKNIMSILGRC